MSDNDIIIRGCLTFSILMTLAWLRIRFSKPGVWCLSARHDPARLLSASRLPGEPEGHRGRGENGFMRCEASAA
jgi:hypothetical protein